MANHVKPTKEQLKQEMNKSLETLDTLPKDGEPNTPPVQPSTPPVVPNTPPTPPVADDPNKPKDPPQDDPNKPKDPPPVDYRAKFVASSNEAQIMSFKNKEVDKAYQESESLPIPTDDEMRAITPNWDDMDDEQRKTAKELIHSKKKLEVLNKVKLKFAEFDKWTETINTFLDNPATFVDHPELEGKKEEFKHFANKPERRTMAMDDIILAFVGEQSKTVPVKVTKPMFEPGSGGPPTPPKPADNRITLAQAEIIKKDNYREYLRLAKAGLIKDDE